MENLFDTAGELADNVKEYLNNRVAAIRLEIAEKTSKVVAVVIAGSMVAVFLLLFLMFLGYSAANVLSNWTHTVWVGPLIVSGAYLFIAILLWRGKERLIRIPVMNAILQQLTGNETD